jgi:hypothetical protein
VLYKEAVDPWRGGQYLVEGDAAVVVGVGVAGVQAYHLREVYSTKSSVHSELWIAALVKNRPSPPCRSATLQATL